jgi:hypothetical protein
MNHENPHDQPKMFNIKLMKTPNIKASLLATLLLCSAWSLRGGVALGDYTLSFGTNLGVWDFSGSYTDYLAVLPGVSTVSMDPSGKLFGTGSGTITEQGDYLDFTGSFAGTTRTVGNVVRVALNLKMIGSGQVEGHSVTFSATAHENLELDPVGLQLIGTASGRATFTIPGIGRRSMPIPTTDVVEAIPPGMIGTWDLTLDVSTNKTKYTGAATATLSNGRSIPLLITGSYAPRTDNSNLRLNGAGLNRAISLALSASVTNAQMTLHKFTGKALGQSLKMPAAR